MRVTTGIERLALSKITKRYHAGAGGCTATVTALDGADLLAHAGEVLAIVGGAGSGKSTLLLCAAGLLRPDEGTIHWMRDHGARRQLRRPRYVDIREFDSCARDPVLLPSLPILLIDSCDVLGSRGHRLAARMIGAARANGDCILVAGRSLDSCATLLADGEISALIQMERGRIVSRFGILPRAPGRVAERPPSELTGSVQAGRLPLT
jgi:energy-coupling factor transporter ATP-binding protein EcfA2